LSRNAPEEYETKLRSSIDAMTSNRPYQGPISSRQAIQELIQCAGTQYDPELVDIFVEIVKEE
jgi:HD-GYP domain-containing protein (c-di-GMP phosphodiesterase class II)